MTSYSIEYVSSNNSLEGMYRVSENIVYRHIDGVDLTLSIVHPWFSKKDLPLLVFVQGSGWSSADIGYQLPQLIRIAQSGFVVATITHRSVFDDNPAPNYLEDAREAIRFLVKKSQHYSINIHRISVAGSSSGANTAQLLAVAPDNTDEKYYIEKVISCFGPSNMVTWSSAMYSNPNFSPTIDSLFPGDQSDKMKRLVSPINYVDVSKKLPKFLLMQGDSDPYIHLNQTLELADKIEDSGGNVHVVIVTGGGHEENFWSNEIIERIISFLKG